MSEHKLEDDTLLEGVTEGPLLKMLATALSGVGWRSNGTAEPEEIVIQLEDGTVRRVIGASLRRTKREEHYSPVDYVHLVLAPL